MPRKKEELRELTPEEKLVCFPIDYFGQILEGGDYVTYPVYRDGKSVVGLARIREVEMGFNNDDILRFTLRVFVSSWDTDKKIWYAHKTALNNVSKCIKLPSYLMESCRNREDVKCIMDA